MPELAPRTSRITGRYSQESTGHVGWRKSPCRAFFGRPSGDLELRTYVSVRRSSDLRTKSVEQKFAMRQTRTLFKIVQLLRILRTYYHDELLLIVCLYVW